MRFHHSMFGGMVEGAVEILASLVNQLSFPASLILRPIRFRCWQQELPCLISKLAMSQLAVEIPQVTQVPRIQCNVAQDLQLFCMSGSKLKIYDIDIPFGGNKHCEHEILQLSLCPHMLAREPLG